MTKNVRYVKILLDWNGSALLYHSSKINHNINSCPLTTYFGTISASWTRWKYIADNEQNETRSTSESIT